MLATVSPWVERNWQAIAFALTCVDSAAQQVAQQTQQQDRAPERGHQATAIRGQGLQGRRQVLAVADQQLGGEHQEQQGQPEGEQEGEVHGGVCGPRQDGTTSLPLKLCL
jgi:hypothetical protein